ncbi:MAG: hypothetical protein ACJ8F7_04055 [Gemmataceae bacterium]
MSAATTERSLTDRATEVLRRTGNPFRNYFARNPDDEVCARYHVPELFAAERDLLLGVVDLYRYDPTTHSEVVPVLGNKGAGKTHLLHSIKHGSGAWQLLVTPGVYQKDSEFLEYLLFQVIDTLLGGGKQKGVRPLEYIGEELVRRLLTKALGELTPAELLELFPTGGLGRWTRKLGLGQSAAVERVQWLVDALAGREGGLRPAHSVRKSMADAGIDMQKAFDLIAAHVERTEAHNTAGMMRRAIYTGFARAALLDDEADLAGFLTFGFAELEFHVRPTRQDLVLALLKVMMEVFRSLKIPVVVAFDQLEDLLLARRSDDSHRVAEAFFAGIVQVMHQIDGLCFLIFAERGLWNRFVPSLDGYIQDRLNNPIHVPEHGTVKALRLEAPSPELVRRVVEARLRPALEELPDFNELSDIFPFTDEQVVLHARTEPTLRDMLQQFRHLFDHVVYGSEDDRATRLVEETDADDDDSPAETISVNRLAGETPTHIEMPGADVPPASRLDCTAAVKSVLTVESEVPAKGEPEMAAAPEPEPPIQEPAAPRRDLSARGSLADLWEQELRSARRKLEPEGALTGATRELQAGLGSFLALCHEHGVKVGPWRLQHVVPEWTFGEHPTYGAVTLAHWACKDGQPWKVGIGLFLGRGAGKPKDLEIKLASMDNEPAVIDHLILLRPEDDLVLSGKSKTLWQDAERRGHHARLEAVTLDRFAALYAFPRWLATVTESQPDGHPLPNLADLIQEKCEKLLEQVCMPVQG